MWCSPTSPFFKLSTDDSSFSNPGPLGFGGCGVINMEKIYTANYILVNIIRNSLGQWIQGFYRSCGHTTNIHAKHLGIYHGLQRSWSLNHRHFIVESDSLTSMALIKQGSPPFHAHAALINSIRSFMSYPWEKLKFQHTYREGNMCAGNNRSVYMWVDLG